MKAWSRLQRYLRFEIGPKLARAAIEASTQRARARLSKSGPLSILVDINVFHHGVTHETTWISTGPTKWGDHDIDTGYAARVPVYSADSKSPDYEDVTYLVGIAHLGRTGALTLHTSSELQSEAFRQPSGYFHGYGYFDFSLFSGIKVECIEDWNDPILPSDVSLLWDEQRQRERMRKRADADPLYAEIVRRFGETNNQDAWHLRVAEAHGMFCFLTMDRKLRNVFGAQRRHEPLKSMRTRVMTPKELGKHLGIRPIHPHLLSYTDANWFVRGDLHLPDEKRRPRRAYRKPGDDTSLS